MPDAVVIDVIDSRPTFWIRCNAVVIDGDLKSRLHQASASASAPASVSVSALALASVPEIGYDVDAWCGLSRYKSLWAITSVNADARCG